ncbi:MAG: trimethylamine methyltransferase family protein [Deltaproteobacteria bacterium]|jgi:trimethylamine--corrinoid protein Co-methyltransferase|nr:trimethylamine methyltransferase family protein [Deltaproteobacteria bacterium]
MAYLKSTLLSQSEQDLIHDQSVECLQEVGIQVDSESVLELLEKEGASVDYENYRAKLPAKMVDRAIESAPKEFTLCGRDPEHDLELPTRSYPYATTNGLCPFINDFETGEYRYATRADIARFTKFGDAIDSVDFLWTSLSATDVPPHVDPLHTLWATLQNTTKHVQCVTVQSAEAARIQIELAALAAGGREELKKRPILSTVVCPISPLFFERQAIESQVEFARAGVPIVSLAMPSGGMSAPVTIAGMMLTANAENLASLVITQAAAPGAPHLFRTESTPMNMVDGSFNYDAPEFGLIFSGMGQMTRRYRLPSFTGDFAAFRVDGDKRDTMFASFIMYCASSSHTDIVAGLGAIDDSKGVCYKQLLVDAYTWECCRKYLEPVDVTEEKLGLDALRDIGPRGNFLTHAHTRKYLRRELIQLDPGKREFLELKKEEQSEKSGELVTEILEKHRVTPLDQSILKKGDDIIEAYEQKSA